MGIQDVLQNARPDVEVRVEWPFPATLTLDQPFATYGQPVLTPAMVNRVWRNTAQGPALTCHNAALYLTPDGRWLTGFRSHLRSGTSVIGAAYSNNFLKWSVDPRLLLAPFSDESPAITQRLRRVGPGIDAEITAIHEYGGTEDLRLQTVTFPDDSERVIGTYSRYDCKDFARVGLAEFDFSHGVWPNTTRYDTVGSDVLMRNVVIAPKPDEHGQYWALVRPNEDDSLVGGSFCEIALATAPSPFGPWTIDGEPVMRSPQRPSWMQAKIGPGANLLESRLFPGTLLDVFHGVRTTMDGNPYGLGVAYHAAQNLRDVLVSDWALLSPVRNAQIDDGYPSHVDNVAFTCGAAILPDGTVVVIYGRNDSTLCLGVTHEKIVAAMVALRGVHPLTGERLYSITNGHSLR